MFCIWLHRVYVDIYTLLLNLLYFCFQLQPLLNTRLLFREMTLIRLVTFDVTNTIIRVLGGVGENYSKVAEIYGKVVDARKLDASFKVVFKHHCKLYPNFGVHSGFTPFQWWTDVVVDSFKAAGSDDQDLERIAQHLYVMFSTQTGWEVLPGVESTLTKLKQNGVKLGVISNFDDRLEKILTQLSLTHYFDFILASAVVKKAKPDPDIFHLGYKMADVKPEDALHVGDNATTDYFGAKRAGCHGLLLLDKDKEIPVGVDKACVISNLEQLTEYI